MSGHTHAQNIRRKKAVIDAKRGKLFSKLAKAIIIAARNGGGDPNANLTLKYAIEKGRQGNMPRDTIARAILKGTGELEGEDLVEQTFEGVGPGGVHIIVECLTDNKNRTAPMIRKLFEKFGGKLGSPGSATWLFERKGLLVIPEEQIGEDDLMELVLESGAEDMSTDGGVHEVTTAPERFETVRKAVTERELEPTTAEVMNIPKSRVHIDDVKLARRVLRFIDALDEHDDVQTVYSNEDIPEDLLPTDEG